jgi:hypothetical protein
MNARLLRDIGMSSRTSILLVRIKAAGHDALEFARFKLVEHMPETSANGEAACTRGATYISSVTLSMNSAALTT